MPPPYLALVLKQVHPQYITHQKNMNPKTIAIIVGIASLGIMTSTSLHAGASNKNGNPFGNGTQFADSGTFSAVARGTVNLSNTLVGTNYTFPLIGVYQFSTGVNQFGGTNGNNATNGVGFCTVFAGDLMSGPAPIGVYNAGNSKVSASYNSSNVYSSTITNTNAPFTGPASGVVPLAARGSFEAGLIATFPRQTFSASNDDTPMSITYLAYDSTGTNSLTVQQLITNLTISGYRLGN